jgi:glyoxylase-like metal-dependent hydrolase (beta-lactamase superfamily II)
VRAVSLHRDVIVVTSQLFQAHCTIIRGPAEGSGGKGASSAQAALPGDKEGAGEGRRGGTGETFLVDSPILPEELGLLGALLEQAEFASPSGLLATHADWDHLLARIAFPDAVLGCAESTAARLHAEPGAAQRELRRFDEELYIERHPPLSLGSIQALAVPGRCGIGEVELELLPADGHTGDGMAVWIPWARVLVAGDYLSAVEIPTLQQEGDLDAYLATLERLRPLLAHAEHVVPGHGPVLDGARALGVLEEDTDYLKGLRERGAEAELPSGRRAGRQRGLHAENLARLTA